MKTAIEEFTLALIRAKAIKPSATKDFVKANTKALEMEKQQAQKYAEFSIHCDRNDFPILEFDAYMNLETFKSE
jgi:hypothetical protein